MATSISERGSFLLSEKYKVNRKLKKERTKENENKDKKSQNLLTIIKYFYI